MKKMIAWFCLLYSCPQALTAQEQQAIHSETTPWPSSLENESELYTMEGYRLFRYRSPTPKQHDQAITVSTQQLVTLLKQLPAPILLDVQPLIWKSGFFIEKEPRLHIPSSYWLPNVGQGELEEAWADYFLQYLQDLTQGRQDYPIVIYCTADCWMSWNAVKRAAQWGYSHLYWYRDGSDGWQEADLETAEGKPEKFTP
ncbi:rhodanese-like domain-containing protein [Neptunomonas japonica]|uniref:Sulfurtransferase n=1 Tax=Neptunomonas japonica JAMM 1380 TaxID=1441457 RepID=A0A7R6PKB0_9GAMM|nr:rhodanese-like domain-containing protein [Neptunomonas japonica]BBB28032.1 sulfurtransferase [Neptunomonas japonica JAMM 1380]